MQLNNESQTTLSKEVRIIPQWVWILSGTLFVGVQVLFDVMLAQQKDAPPAWARVLLGLLLGLVVGTFIAFLGYINRDAKRRGMSPLLWTLVALLIPNALGILLYFVLRQPVQNPCAKCGNAVQPGFNFCPRCSHKLNPSCPQCQRVIGSNDVYCPYCGTAART
jgi:RNA polymerase subunit RPABC4/transcription elongation factor Spt4